MTLQKIFPKGWPDANAFGGRFERYVQDEVSTDFIDIRELEETKKTVVSQREPATPAKQKSAKKTPAKKSTKKVETPPAYEKRSTSKKAEKEVVNNSLPKKKATTNTNKKGMSIRDKYPEKFKWASRLTPPLL